MHWLTRLRRFRALSPASFHLAVKSPSNSIHPLRRRSPCLLLSYRSILNRKWLRRQQANSDLLPVKLSPLNRRPSRRERNDGAEPNVVPMLSARSCSSHFGTTP